MGLNKTESMSLFKLRLSKDASKEKPYFYQLVKNGNDWAEGERSREFSGTLVDARVDSYDYRGESKYKLELIFNGIDGKEKLEMGINAVGRSVINTLAGTEAFGKNVMLRVYEKEGYNNVYIEVDGEKASWRFTPDEIKGINLTGKENRWADMFNTYVAPAAKEFNIDPFAPAANEFNPAPSEEKEEEVDDDLPF